MTIKTYHSFAWIFFSLFLTFSLEARAVTIVHTNDVLAEIEPCGCRKNPQGGMARKSNLLKKLQTTSSEKSKSPFIIQLDAGDLLFQELTLPPLLAEQAKLQAEYVLKSMDMLHHDAVTPGEKDFALGYKVFEELRKKSKIKFLAANLKHKNGGAYLEASSIFKGKNEAGEEVNVGVIGIVGADLKWPKELKASPAIAAAEREVHQLRKKVDYLIVLSHQGLDEDVKLAKKVKGIDLIVGAHSQSFLQTPARFGDTLIVQSSFRNQYVGVLQLNKPIKDLDYQLIGLDAGYESPAESPSEMDALVKDFKKGIADLNSKSTNAIADLSAGTSDVSAENQKYQTFPKCAECHLKQFEFWRKTAHFGALKSLITKQQSKNKECLQCHTVGLGEPNGFKDVNVLGEVGEVDSKKVNHLSQDELHYFIESLAQAKSVQDSIKLKATDKDSLPIKHAFNRIVKAWAPVQCENCHGAGGDHPFSSSYSKVVKNETCMKCHTAERAPEWYNTDGKPNLELIEKKKKSVSCPAGELVEAE